MEINTASPALPQQATSGAANESVISSDFETFIKMLTTQMENQDPLNPLDSQDFATQLATFSGVGQQVKTNDLLGALGNQMLLSGLGDMASWVGREARLAVAADFDGSPVEIVPNPPIFADSVQLIAYNSDGEEVQRLPLPVSDAPVTWAGVGSDGSPFEPGQYSFEIESTSNGEVIDTHTPDIFSQVSEVRIVDGATVVVLNGGSIYPSNTVTGLR